MTLPQSIIAAKKLVVQAGAQLDDWGTPADVLEFVRECFGGQEIDIDLASNPKANELVRAQRYYSVDNPCPEYTVVTRGELVWCNPPGPVDNVRKFWVAWCRAAAKTGRGGFLAFNMDHWRGLLSPCGIQVSAVILPKRLRFVGATSQYNHPSVLFLVGGTVRRPYHTLEWQ